MLSNLAVALFALGTLVSMNAYASTEIEDKKRRVASRSNPVTFDSIVDIHASSLITTHPTRWISAAEAVTQLEKLRIEGEARERHLRAWHASKGRVFPERFAGD